MPPGPPPKLPGQRRRRNAPAAGEWHSTEATHWQYGPIPEPPEGLLKASEVVWRSWFQSWVAAHWTPGDVPQLCIVIGLYDLVLRGASRNSNELRLWMGSYGLTPAGAQQRRWLPPSKEAARQRVVDPYNHLRLLPDRKKGA
jgi:hypothetical protein